METNKGFTKINNDILYWEWYTQTNTKVLYFHLLLRANFEAKSWRGIIIERGQTVGSPESLAIETGLTISKVRTAIENLIRTNDIKKESTNKYSVFTLLKYDAHTCSDLIVSKQTIKQTSKQIATTKETKDIKIINTKEREDINKNSHSNFLLLNFDSEYLKLFSDYKNKINDIDHCIEKFYNDKPEIKWTIFNLKSWFKNWTVNDKSNCSKVVELNPNQRIEKIGCF